MDQVLARMLQTAWRYAPHDPGAVAQMTARLVQAAAEAKPIPYSDVVRGIDFHGGSALGRPVFQIDVHAWRDFDRALVGDLLGFISTESYRKNGFMLSALAVSADDGQPGEPSRAFFAWCRSLGLIRRPGKDAELEFWVGQVQKAQTWAKGRRP